MFFFKKKEIALSLEDVPSAVREHLQTGLEAESGIARHVDSIQAELARLGALLGALQQKDSPYPFVNSVKKSFCDRSHELISIEKPETRHASLLAYTGNLEKALSGINNISIKEVRHLSTFKDDMKAISLQTKIIEIKLTNLKKALEGARSMKKAEAVERIVSKISGTEKSIRQAESAIAGSTKDVHELSRELEKKRAELVALVNDEDFSRLQNLGNEIDNLEDSNRLIKQKIGTEIGAIDGIMKKFSHTTMPKSRIMRHYMDSPGSAFLADDGLEINAMLNEMKSSADAGKIKADKKEKVRLVTLINSLGELYSLKKEYIRNSKNIENFSRMMNEQLTPLQERKNTMEEEILRLEARITAANDSLARAEGEKKRLENTIIAEKGILMEELSEIFRQNVRLK